MIGTKVAVWTDGHGSFQARCIDCSWRGPWRERGSKAARNEAAVEDAKGHTHG